MKDKDAIKLDHSVSKPWFTGDTHFGHANIIRLTKRPFADVLDMRGELIRNWNDRVAPKDIVYHLGDFTYRGEWADIVETWEALNGYKVLIKGNHDHERTIKELDWFGVHDSVMLMDLSGHHRLYLHHYPVSDWPGRFHDVIHLHGHIHAHAPRTGRMRYDVGVDANGFAPVALSTILQWADADKELRIEPIEGTNPEKGTGVEA